MTTTEALLETPFHRFHVDQGAKMVDFAGWSMPMLYRSIIEEHKQVRASAGIFDISHMGRLRITGPGACGLLDRLCTRQIQGMADGQCRYTLVCNDRGGCRDDMLVYRLAADAYLMVPNAANRAKILDHIAAHRGSDEVEVRDETLETGMLALQGPQVIDLIAPFAPEVAELRRFRFVQKNVAGADILISRTGYTGEDGVEVIMPASFAEAAIGLLAGGLAATQTVTPAGLGARDTLRLEAALPLYGHEITEEIDPLSAGLAFAVTLDKGEFIGAKALEGVADRGPARRLAGLVLAGRRTARQGMKVLDGASEIGIVTSACLSPTLGSPIAMAYLEPAAAEAGRAVAVDLGRGQADARVVELPFYKR